MTSSLSIEINASVALKLANIGAESYPNIESGPIYGFNESESSINIAHIFQFPAQYSSSSSNNDDIFNMKSSNIKYQADILKRLQDTEAGVKLLGWFLSSVGGKTISQSIIEAIINLQQLNLKENRDTTPVLFLVYDPSKSFDGLLSLKALKLSEAFMKTWNSDEKFIAKNLIENRLSYRNIFDEVPMKIKNSHLINLTIQQEFSTAASEEKNLELTINNMRSVDMTTENLHEAIDNLNHNLGNLNYYQRNLSRELTKVNQWKLKTKQDNEEKLKADPNAKLDETEQDWNKHFKLPTQPSKYESLVVSSLINNYCNNLEISGAVELVKTTGAQKSLGLN
ncbi:hypothetical protein CANARDRAFT_30736 [[Candida] arabinofermentans NRRL YB-2248]|uniref:eIF3h C-terminal domain-containing protein n=1 Tax=[Candida] arabinofermentans NRRL YB-2248 TaxID=983967 RepID=A0A1E4SSU8_9ASCO|nr:hypothetical protein CANARDRAFT_30736 [[Candida] arabinofermentans NRRL YB-2248]